MQKNSVLIQDIGQKSDTESYNGEGQRAKQQCILGSYGKFLAPAKDLDTNHDQSPLGN